jgi:hypothetical protein
MWVRVMRLVLRCGDPWSHPRTGSTISHGCSRAHRRGAGGHRQELQRRARIVLLAADWVPGKQIGGDRRLR